MKNEIVFNMNNSQHKTLVKIFQDPVPADILWKDIESLFT